MKARPSESRETRDFRKRLVAVLLRVITATSLIALVPSVWLSVTEKIWPVLIGDIFATLLVAFLAFVPSVPYKFKVGVLVLLPYALGVLLIWETGPYGAGHIFIFAFVFLVALFGGWTSIALANGLAILTHVGFAFAKVSGLVGWGQGLDSIIVISSNFVMVSLILSFSAHYLVDRYASAASQESKLRAELELMLHEIEHRVKNNIQVILSIVNLKSRRGSDPAAAIEDIKASLSAIAAVHQLLYRRDTVQIIGIRKLVEELVSRYRMLHQGITWKTSWEGEDAELEGDKAVDLGLLINELVMNSLKHGFPGGRQGSIFIEMNHDIAAHEFRMRIGDDGVGHESVGETEGEGGRGLKIIRAIAGHLGAVMELEEGSAWVYRIHFSLLTR